MTHPLEAEGLLVAPGVLVAFAAKQVQRRHQLGQFREAPRVPAAQVVDAAQAVMDRVGCTIRRSAVRRTLRSQSA